SCSRKLPIPHPTIPRACPIVNSQHSNKGTLMPANSQTEYRYNRLTWPEMNDAIAAQKLIILPTASTEQHGKHLPLDVDLFLCESVCLEVGRRAADQVLVLPAIAYGLNLHHIDFPGTIHIEPETFIAFCLNITKSVGGWNWPSRTTTGCASTSAATARATTRCASTTSGAAGRRRGSTATRRRRPPRRGASSSRPRSTD